MFFESWSSLGRIALVGALAYVSLIVLLRIFGKRMLSKMNAFDLIVTVALGSTLATVITSKSVPLADGLMALLVLLGLQFVLAWAAARSRRVDHVIKSEPRLLLFRGRFLEDALRAENVSRSGVLAYVRKKGFSEIESIEAVVLESDGSMNVIAQAAPTSSAMSDVNNYPPR